MDNVIAGLALDVPIVTLDGVGPASTRVGNSHGALVQDGRFRSARATVEGMSIQVKRNLLGRIDGDVFRGAGHRLDGLALCGRTDRIGQRLVLLAADLGNIVAFLDAIGAICVLGGG